MTTAKSACPIPRDSLLAMVREEAAARVSPEFQAELAAEERTRGTNGSSANADLQVSG